ncbi:hypothetical protein M3Y99_01762300 [Aphelenchoides fujianensis]|nr:hypothetical protein M3Y99_01762300 [Aphelenchoides fujianensis]
MGEQKETLERNLRSLRAIDPFADQILHQGVHVAVYSFNGEQRAWKREDVAGPFFVYMRKDKPFFSFVIVNRQSPEDLIQPILPKMSFELNAPYVFINKNDGSSIMGLWFTSEADCTDAHKLFEDLKDQSMASKPQLPERLVELPPEPKDFIKMLLQGSSSIQKP